MINLLKIVGLMALTALFMVLFTAKAGGEAVTEILGVPVVAAKQGHAHGWIAIGQFDARGVIVLAQNGFGLVAITQGGAGILFGLGQLVGGLVCIGQAGLGLFFFLGQVGAGLQALGQGVFRSRPGDWFKEMNQEFGELLAFRRPPGDS